MSIIIVYLHIDFHNIGEEIKFSGCHILTNIIINIQNEETGTTHVISDRMKTEL